MPESIRDILDELDALAQYDGPWRVLRRETPLLRERLRELRERETRLDDVLIVALVGGSGVGKSTLLNALAGDQLAATSEMRPCTSVPTVYHPPGVRLDLADWRAVSGSALEQLVIIDTPDSDTVVREHRARVQEVLALCDLILICAGPEKYLDEATWSLLRPLQHERAMVCVETKASDQPSVREHWLGRLRDEGFTIGEYFRVNALRTLDRKLSGGMASPEEQDFPRLESYLRHELTRDRIRRIKRSNAAGLLTKTISALQERVAVHGPDLQRLEGTLDAVEIELTKAGLETARRRLFASPHLWSYAQGREISLRTKGIVGTTYRILETLRSLPARMTGWLPWSRVVGAGRKAAALLSDRSALDEDLGVASDELDAVFQAKGAELALAFAQAGFDRPAQVIGTGESTSDEPAGGLATFRHALDAQVAAVLRGPARDRLITRADKVTSWPVTVLLDVPPLAFLVFSGYKVVRAYFSAVFLTGAFFLNALAVLALLLGGEVLLLSIVGRILAWSARRGALTDLRQALSGRIAGFPGARAALHEVRACIDRIDALAGALRE